MINITDPKCPKCNKLLVKVVTLTSTYEKIELAPNTEKDVAAIPTSSNHYSDHKENLYCSACGTWWWDNGIVYTYNLKQQLIEAGFVQKAGGSSSSGSGSNVGPDASTSIGSNMESLASDVGESIDVEVVEPSGS